MSEQPTLQQIPLGDIEHPSPFQTRRFTDGAGVDELAESIRQVGVLEPILVRPEPGHQPWPYQLLAGERRLRAANIAGLEAIPAIVRDLDDDAALEVTVTENLHREDLHPLDEAAAIEMLLQRYEDPKEVAARIGRPLSFVARRSRLTTLTEAWRKAIEYRPPAAREINMGEPCRECGDSPEEVPADQWALPDLCLDCADVAGIRSCRYCGCTDEVACDEGCEWVDDDLCSSCQEHDDALDLSNWGVTHLEVIARLEPADQDAFLKRLARWAAPRMTAAQLEQDAAAWLRKLSAAPWKCSDAELLPEAGACTECPLRASVNPGLFDDVEEGKGIPAGDRCLSASCWDQKLELHIAATLDLIKADTGKKPRKLTTNWDRKGDALYDDWSVTTSEKPKKGYEPAVRIDGPQAGHVVYITVKKRATSSGGTGKKKAAVMTAAEKLAAGQDRLERRRLKLANESIIAAIEETNRTPKPRDVWALVVCAGCTDRHAYHANELPRREYGSPAVRAKDAREKAIGKTRFTWTAFEGLSSAAKLNAGAELVWHESVWPHIQSRCEYSSHRDPKGQHQELCAVADLVKIDHVALTRKATDEIPEPKSWAKLREQIKLERADAKKSKKRGKEAAAA